MEQLNPLKDALAIKYIAHYKSSIRNGLFLYPQSQTTKLNKLIFPAANSIVSNTLSSNFDSERHQSFFHTVPGSKGITCMTQSANRKLLAWAEQTQTYPIITCVDLITGKKRMFATEIKSSKFVSLAFNSLENGDAKVLVALTNGPDYSLVQWNFDKNKFVVNLIEKVDKVERNDPLQKYTHLFFYKEEDYIVLLGQGVMKTVKLINQKLQFKDSPFARKDVNEKDFNFISYAVLKDGLVVGTQNGQILYFTVNCQFKTIISTSPGQGSPVETLLYLPTTKCFVAGCGDGQLILYEKGDIRNVYSRSEKILNINESKGRITSLITTSKSDYIFVGMEPGIVLRSYIEKTDDWQFDLALQNFHTDSITGLDICMRKPLFATCSLDRTVKIWNFSQKNNIEVSKTFEQKASCLSFHPSGLHLAVCFPDKIRLLSISNGDIVPYKDISQKSCYDVKFSNGGHLFAVANSVMVQIFNFWTYQQSPGHQFKCQTGKFTYILWEEDDLGVFLGTSDGSVYYNKLQDSTVRLHILSVPGFTVTSIYSLFYAKDQKQTLLNERVVYVSGIFNQAVEQQQKCIFELKITPRSQKDRQIPKQQAKYTVSQPQKIFTACNISNINMLNSHRLFIYSTDDKALSGSIRFSRYPLNSSKQLSEIQSHSGRVTKICVCYDDGLVFSAGEDGSLVIYQVKDKQMRIKLQILDSAQEFLYSKTQLKAQKNQLQQLKVKNLQTRAKRDKIQKEQSKQRQRLKQQWSAKNVQRQRQQSDKMMRLTDEMSLMQKQQTQRLAMLEAQYKNKKTAVENDYKQKMLLEQTRKTELAKTKEQEARTFGEIVEVTKLKHKEQRQLKQLQLRNQQKKEREQKQRLIYELEQMKKQHKIMQDQSQNDAQKQVKVKIEDQEQSYRKLEEQNMKAEAQARAKKTALQGQIKKVAEENHKLSDTGEQLQRQKRIHEELQQKKTSHSKEIQERQKTIRDKMTRIQELKKKTQELQKFKFVLDYKIKQLKRDIGPREEQIAKMKEQIANMNAQIILFKRTTDNMKLIVKDLTSKRKGMEQQLSNQSHLQAVNTQYIKSFQIDISQMVQGSLQDFKKLKVKMLEIYRKYVQDQDDKRKVQNVDHQKQFIKERQHLESTVKSLKQKFKTHMKLHQADNKRIMGQNQDLISEINDLRRQRKNMWDEVKKKNEQKEQVKRFQEEKLMVEREGEQLRKKLQTLRTQYQQALRRNTGMVRDLN